MKNLLLFLSVLFIVSCSKQDAILPNVDISEETDVLEGVQEITKTNIDYHYFFNDNEVEEGTFSLKNEALIISICVMSETEHQIHAFTTKQAYFDWGKKMNLPTELEIEVTEHLRDYAQNNGYAKHYEETGEVHEDYLAYQTRYYNEKVGLKPQRGTWMVLRKDFTINQTTGQVSLSGGSMPYTIPMPTMPITWNNRTSGLYQLNLYGGASIFDRAFFLRRLGTVWLWGWQDFAFAGPYAFYNNRASSLLGF